MFSDQTAMRDHLEIAARYARDRADRVGVIGYGAWTLVREGEVIDAGHFGNLVTQQGDLYYVERAAGLAGAPAVVTGMQLGTGTTAPAKTGAGAAVVTVVANSLVALSATPTSSLSGSSRRVLYSASWGAGVATADGIAEVVLVNQSTGTQTAAPASATVSRGLLSTTVNKASGDILNIEWSHDFLGA